MKSIPRRTRIGNALTALDEAGILALRINNALIDCKHPVIEDMLLGALAHIDECEHAVSTVDRWLYLGYAAGAWYAYRQIASLAEVKQ